MAFSKPDRKSALFTLQPEFFLGVMPGDQIPDMDSVVLVDICWHTRSVRQVVPPTHSSILIGRHVHPLSHRIVTPSHPLLLVDTRWQTYVAHISGFSPSFECVLLIDIHWQTCVSPVSAECHPLPPHPARWYSLADHPIETPSLHLTASPSPLVMHEVLGGNYPISKQLATASNTAKMVFHCWFAATSFIRWMPRDLDFVELQAFPPPILTPTRLRTAIQATNRDGGPIYKAQARCAQQTISLAPSEIHGPTPGDDLFVALPDIRCTGELFQDMENVASFHCDQGCSTGGYGNVHTELNIVDCAHLTTCLQFTNTTQVVAPRLWEERLGGTRQHHRLLQLPNTEDANVLSEYSIRAVIHELYHDQIQQKHACMEEEEEGSHNDTKRIDLYQHALTAFMQDGLTEDQLQAAQDIVEKWDGADGPTLEVQAW
ncbi:hypothetical protein EDD15DRAFT_2198396 [Pisolithus albus]|nr:hypothetical protein EDD15DRAFT_2198396 [Pisolithus albus]